MLSDQKKGILPEIKPSLTQLVSHIETARLLEISYPNLELKSGWDKPYGKDISAIANHESQEGGWLIVGVDDNGNVLENSEKWARRTESIIGNQINQFLDPSHSVHKVVVHGVNGKFYILIDIINPGDITEWDGEAYKLTGSSSTKMKVDEKISLSMRLPGDDYSNQPWSGVLDSVLVMDFAKKMAAIDPGEFPENLSNLSSSQIINRLNLEGKMAAGILFGEFPVRIAKYDANDDIITNNTKKGTYNILTDDFISQIQAWTRKQGTIIEGHSTSVKDEDPYPRKALREVLANAVVHALYQREQGGIIVDIYPDHLTVRNNALLEANAFSRQWFAKKTFVKNKLLMTTLRAAKITDELGTGKTRIFRQMIEAGRQEPLISFLDCKNFGKWEMTVFNNRQDEHLTSLIKKFYELFPTANHARIATALVLWRNHKWSTILDRLDDYYRKIAIEVVEHQYAPVILIEGDLFERRWVGAALTGQATKRFTPNEEKKLEYILHSFSFNDGRQGFITTDEAKQIIGLGDSRPETTQLSNLFRKWRDQGLVKNVKRGHWQFLAEEDKKQIFMSKKIEEVSSIQKLDSKK